MEEEVIVVDEKVKNAREKALKWVEGKGFKSIKASFAEDYNDPKSFVRSSNGNSVAPDITAESSSGKSYFEIAQKTSQKQPLITKWKLLSQLAQNKNGQFVIFTPHGHKSFAQNIVEEHHITAKLVAI